MKGRFALSIFLVILSAKFSLGQITVDQVQLSEALKEKMMEDITDKITSSIQSGEAWVANETYFSIVLEPFEPFGINPSDPNFINQANEIYQSINQKIEEDPSLTRSGLLKDEIKGIVKQGLINYASTYIDKESYDIYDQCSNLFSDGQQKIEKLLKAAEGISDLDQDDADYESEVTALLKYYGIKSDYFYLIDDLDQILSVGYDKLADPISAFSTVASAMSSNDPIYKIEMLLDLGETFGGKVPIIGDLITPIFTLGKGVLSAAKGLENVLERNLNQGCINTFGGTYASTNENKRTLFISKFPGAGRVCPMNQDVYNPVYNNIYVSTGSSADLYFYMNKKWQKGKIDNLHVGQDDIFWSVQWLRRNGYAEMATDLNFIFTSFQKKYGWKTYTEEVQKRINRIQLLFQNSYSTVNSCDKDKIEQFYMSKIDFNWLVRLLDSNELEYSWNNLKYFASSTQDILNSMIRNYYLSRHQDNLNNLDRIIKNLEENLPVNIYGTVYDDKNYPIAGAKLQIGYNSMFSTGDPDHKVITSNNGYFSYYLLMRLNNNLTITASAVTPDGKTITEDIPVEPALKINAYQVELRLPYQQPDTTSTSSQDTTIVNEDEQIRNSDCAGDPYATAIWDPVNQLVICTCNDYYVWDESQKKCIPDIQAILTNSDCSQWPNTEAKWDYSTNEPYCDCKPGFEWNEDFTECISKQDLLVAQTDCSQYLNAHAVWDAANQQVICDCLPGFEWNEDYTKCISKELATLEEADCSMYPNTEAIWDPASQQAYCDCKPGYEWNEDYTACEKIVQQQQQQPLQYDCSDFPNSHPVFDPVSNQMVCDCNAGFEWNNNYTACLPIRKKPDVDWGNILTATMDIINAAGGNNPYSGGSNMTGTGIGSNTQNQQAVVHQSNCNDKQEAGGDAPEVHNINLGQAFGTFVFDYETYSVKDQIIVSQGGQTILNTGCVGESGSIPLNLNGFSSTISVRVNPNCDGTSGTSWNFTVHCPRQ